MPFNMITLDAGNLFKSQLGRSCCYHFHSPTSMASQQRPRDPKIPSQPRSASWPAYLSSNADRNSGSSKGTSPNVVPLFSDLTIIMRRACVVTLGSGPRDGCMRDRKVESTPQNRPAFSHATSAMIRAIEFRCDVRRSKRCPIRCYTCSKSLSGTPPPPLCTCPKNEPELNDRRGQL